MLYVFNFFKETTGSRKSPNMYLQYVFMLSGFLLLPRTVTAEQFYVAPSSSPSCPEDHCIALTDIVLNSSQYFTSNSVITFLPGLHQTNITGNLTVLIKDVRNISIVGYNYINNDSLKSVIHCTRLLGFAFINVTTLKIAKLSFSFCGMYFPSKFTDEKNFVYPPDVKTRLPVRKMYTVTLYFLQTVNVTISKVTISNSTGAGLLGINMLGLSNISQTTLSGNKPNCLLLFLDIPSTSQVIPSTILTIEESHMMFGKLPHHVDYTNWCATGLGIMLAQVTYNVHICMNRIIVYGNMKRWNYNGNLYFTIEKWECRCSVIHAKQITSTNIFNKTTLQRGDEAKIYLDSSRKHRMCTCSKPAEEKYIVHILDSYFVGVGISVSRSKHYIWHINNKIKLQNITVKNCINYPAMYISDMEYIEMDNVTFTHNHDFGISLYRSNIIASGRCYFINNTGFASILYLRESRIYFYGEVEFIGNKVKWATVILAKSTMKFQQTAKLVDNKSRVGGAIALYGGSGLVVGNISNVSLLRNYAQQDGGAILVDQSEIIMKYGAKMIFTENKAYNGGALALQNGARLIFKSHSQITFKENDAQQYGGALHVEEPGHKIIRNNRGYWILCFFELSEEISSHAMPSLIFANNTADTTGSSLFGGWGNLCTYSGGKSGAHNFKSMFHFHRAPSQLSAVSSNPTRVCLCTDDHLPDCNITQYNITAYPGETFQISAVAVGQMFGTVPISVHTSFISASSSSPPRLKPLQGIQQLGKYCTNLVYTIASSHPSEDMILTVEKLDKQITQYILQYPDGKKLPLVLQNLHLHIQLNICPLGFLLYNSSCICHPQLQQHAINCSIETQKVNRPSLMWINATFVNASQYGILVHKHCPFDYCKLGSFDFNLQNPDEQCAFNRSGILCGACQQNLSHVFGTSACRECSSLWALLWVPVIALAGVALVVLLIVLNLTVAVGTINGLIFYANIVRANHASFFPPSTANSFLSWFIAWINLDLGIETCFYNGLDAYVKTWLQFVFPLYIWFLVITIIVLSHYSTNAARLSGRNAVQVLATLFLLSYAKLLRIIITVFQSTELEYYNTIVRKVWLYDGNTNYLKGKHIPLFIVALLLLLISLPYTAILILIQYLQHWSSYRVLFWVKKLKPLFDAYTGPYKDRHRYWTGLLLLVRIVLFVIFSTNTQGSADINLLAVSLTVLFLLVCVAITGGVYKTWPLNAIEYSFLFNLGVLTSTTLYTIINGQGQVAVVYTSVSIAFAMFITIVAVHMLIKLKHYNWISVNIVRKLQLMLCKLRSAPRKLYCKQNNPHQNTQPRVTHASLELRESLLEYCSQ